jgi:hypothetical protein
VRRFYQEVIHGRNLDALDELLTPDWVDHTFGSQSVEQAKQFFGVRRLPRGQRRGHRHHGQYSRRSMPVRWAWLDLNQRSHPER